MLEQTAKDTIRANNKYYFKAFNDDYRIDGVYRMLDNSEFRMIVTLQAYANDCGMVMKLDTKGYSRNELSKLVGLNYRTTEIALSALESYGLVTIDDGGGICLTTFLTDNTSRENSQQKAKERNRAIQQSIATRRAKQSLGDVLMKDINATNMKVAQLSEKVNKMQHGIGE